MKSLTIALSLALSLTPLSAMAQQCTIQVSMGNSHGIPAGFYQTGAKGHNRNGMLGYWVRGMIITEASVSPMGCADSLPTDDSGD